MEHDRIALVLGATGGVGGAIAAALLRHGWKVRAMARNMAAAEVAAQMRIEWIEGDAMRRDDVLRAGKDASVIVHAVNPPGYQNWDKLTLPMIDNTIAAARMAGARVVLPGTIYNYDPAAAAVIDSDTPQQPKSRKGKIRVEMERRLEQAAPEVPSLIVRAGDFFGPGVRSSWFAQAMVSPGRPVRRIINPARGAGHSWAYLPDLAETFARLLDAPERLKPFERLQFEGLYDDNGHRLVEAIRRARGKHAPVHRFPWWLMKLASPFAAFPREAAEIAPYWRHPVRFDNRRLVELIGPEPRTALDDAMRASLADMGSLSGKEASGRIERKEIAM